MGEGVGVGVEEGVEEGRWRSTVVECPFNDDELGVTKK